MSEFLTATLFLLIATFWLLVNLKAGVVWLKMVSIAGMLVSIAAVMFMAFASLDQLIK